MIVRDDGPDLLLITQADHAAMAAEVMAHWQAQEFPQRATRAIALHATAHHDLGWAPEDAAPRVSPGSGRPLDFTQLDAAARQALWPRAVAEMAGRSAYGAALVAQHAIAIHRRQRAEPAWQAFFASLEALRDHWFAAEGPAAGAAAGVPPDPPPDDRLAFLQDSAIVGMGDLISLLVCTGWTHVEAADGYEVRARGDLVEVAPDPFGGREIAVRVAARRIPARRYTTDDELRAALASAAPHTLTARVIGVEVLA
jgi:hypothetical protein